jgi:hypothetical protein
MWGDVILSDELRIGLMEGRINLPKLDCWMQLVDEDYAKVPNILPIKIGCPVVFFKGDEIMIDWDFEHTWYANTEPPLQLPAWGMIYAGEVNVAKLDLDGPFDLRTGDITIRMNVKDHRSRWQKFKDWMWL